MSIGTHRTTAHSCTEKLASKPLGEAALIVSLARTSVAIDISTEDIWFDCARLGDFDCTQSGTTLAAASLAGRVCSEHKLTNPGL